MKIASKAKGKAFFIVFKGLSNSIKCLRPQSGPFNTSQINAAIIKKSANLILHCKSIDWFPWDGDIGNEINLTRTLVCKL